MKTKHTSGPWECKESQFGYSVFTKENSMRIAMVFSDWDNPESNARLIAAAPELLEALKDLLSTEECVCDQAKIEQGTCSVCIYEKLIEKAQGGAE